MNEPIKLMPDHGGGIMTISEMEEILQSAGERLFTLTEYIDAGSHPPPSEEALFGIGQFLRTLTKDVKMVREALELHQ
jgi:hypothetical protein